MLLSKFSHPHQVEYLHDRHIVHMDIKPENIMCTEREGTTIKIVDFGTALLLSPGHRVAAKKHQISLQKN